MQTNTDASQDKQKRQWQRWQIVYAITLLGTTAVSFVFQVGNIGWFLIILGILYLFGFAVHFCVWLMTVLLSKRQYTGQHLLFALNNVAFLVANVFNIDFGDTGSYMFFMRYQDPSEALAMVGFVGWGAWLLTLLLHLLVRLIMFLRYRGEQAQGDMMGG